MATPSSAPGAHVTSADQRVVMYRVPWSHYEAELAVRGEHSVPRLSYLRGTLELMSPSREHERIAAWIGRLLEVYAEEHDVHLAPYGSWTLKHPELAGAEPDECYIVGRDQRKDRPDVAIEVVWTRGGIDKLEIYRHLEIPEVWFWIDEALTVHVLGEHGYAPVERSRLVPEIDLRLLCSFLDEQDFLDAKRAYRAAIRRR